MTSSQAPVDPSSLAHFVDLQVNGYAGIDFNGLDPLTAEQLKSVCERLQADGVQTFLPTLITADESRMCQRAKRIMTLRSEVPLAQSMIPGLHLEGPFLNEQPGFIGAHPPQHAKPANLETMRRLMDAADGQVRLVTLAPERDPDARVTAFLADQGVMVAAGHSDASLNDLRRAIDAGLRMYTHLGNGCPAVLARHDNIIQRVLSLSDRLAISFIADGHHVPAVALGNYLRLVPARNVVIVTDAIAAAGLGPGFYQLGEMQVEVTEDGAAWGPGRKYFAGAAVTMPRSCEVLREQLGISAEVIRRWTVDNPKRLLFK